MMKVFKMNDWDWVAHYSEEQAKSFYQDFTSISMDEIEEDFQGEVPLTDKMHWEAAEVDKLTPNHRFKRVEDSPFGDCYLITFEWAIDNNSHLYPGLISSTEY